MRAGEADFVKILAPGITSDRDTLQGEPCFAGTRIPVRTISGIARGHGVREAQDAYPMLSVKQIEEAVAFMAAHPRAARGKPVEQQIADMGLRLKSAKRIAVTH